MAPPRAGRMPQVDQEKATFSAEQYCDSAAMHLAKRDAMTALAVCIEGLELYPENVALLCTATKTCIANQYLSEARLYADKAMSLQVGSSAVHEIHGDLLLLEGVPAEALNSYRRAQGLRPDPDVLQKKVDHARYRMNRMRPKDGTRGVRVRYPQEMARAGQLERDGKGAEAEGIYRGILRRDPNHVEAMRHLAAIASQHRKYRDAEVFLRQAITVAPDYARAWLELSVAQLDNDLLQEAIDSARRVVELAPETAEAHLALGNALARADWPEEAAEAYRAALDLAPDHAGAFSGLGQQLKTIGRQAEAIEIYRKSIKSDRMNAEPYWSLANMKTFRFEDEDMQTMQSMLDTPDLPEQSAVQLCNALGFALENRKDYDRAFHYFSKGNKIQRVLLNYDPVETEVTTDRHIAIFSRDFFQQRAGQGSEDAAPIFIVGLPRSGSTLLEQILASHSQVDGTHELSDLGAVAHSLPQRAAQQRFPENLPELGDQVWSKLGDAYIERTQKYRRGAPRFIDKNPNNFFYAGFIRQILPNARIINAKRHPIDSCLGSYKQLFAQGQPFTYDLTEVGEYYVQYQRLMDHWHEVLPGFILDVQYEEVVADVETQVRRILEFCKLPFEQGCVDFHKNQRAVKTASSEQVRQPIYSSSVDLWKRYEGHLGELIEILEPILHPPLLGVTSDPISKE